ncbi:MAG: acetyl/propionyl/methylcrotonyl-CoA carboxylase subunit alpha [Kiloniellales bacterium]
MPLFDKILIANRGEIACRVIKSCQRLGIKTVAVYSDADADSLAVRLADEAVAIGPAPSAESYLRADRIIQACKDTGAQAVHPGFGFLSEKAAFAEALEAAGIVFIGPPAGAIEAMGDKIASKQLAQDAKVSSVPGHLEAIPDAERAVEIARGIGYPVMIKASAGGGGKGMRIAHSDEEAREGFRSAQNEARSSFGDDRVFIEKFVEEPRHIEIQVLGDKHGKVVHLNERECSIQRRHQKVLEEAPSPFLDPETRAAMGAQAVALAKAVDYHSAGTVEFIVDKDKNFYFLEMNTRLQVEHPVTELITGIDLVEWMIRVAAGEPLTLEQEDIAIKGWAVEARVYAEDPARGFLPSIGRLARYIPPAEGPSVRIDSGVNEGSEISIYYDPMIAKLIGYGETRDAAADSLAQALDSYYIRGINHNAAFLTALVRHPRFRAGQMTTNFIAEEFPDGYRPGEPEGEVLRSLVLAAAMAGRRVAEREGLISGQVSQLPRHLDDWVVCLEGDNSRHEHAVRLQPHSSGFSATTALGDGAIESAWQPGAPLIEAQIDGVTKVIQVDRRGPRWIFTHAGAQIEALVLQPMAAKRLRLMPIKAPPDLSRFLLSPMPGLLVSIAVEVGQMVKAGEELAVVEAMKMENVLRAAADSTVKALHCAPGESLSVDQAIVEFE